MKPGPSLAHAEDATRAPPAQGRGRSHCHGWCEHCMDVFLNPQGRGLLLNPSSSPATCVTNQALSIMEIRESQRMQSGLLFPHPRHISEDGTGPGQTHGGSQPEPPRGRRGKFLLFTCFWKSLDNQSLSIRSWPRVI